MIRRDVLTNSALLDNFDHYNDAKDTLNWLRALGTPQAAAIADELAKRNDEWFENFCHRQSKA